MIRPPTATRERCQLLSNDRIFSREVVQQGCSRSRDYDGTMIEDEHFIDGRGLKLKRSSPPSWSVVMVTSSVDGDGYSNRNRLLNLAGRYLFKIEIDSSDWREEIQNRNRLLDLRFREGQRHHSHSPPARAVPCHSLAPQVAVLAGSFISLARRRRRRRRQVELVGGRQGGWMLPSH